jgi:hypothetical protein
MKLNSFLSALVIFLGMLICSSRSFAQTDDWNKVDSTGFYNKDITKRGKYTLVFINKSPVFGINVQQKLTGLFFKVYPEEAAYFNPKSATTVTLVIDPGFTGVAATLGALTRFDPQWFKNNPEDIDCATHELMHIVQAYDFRQYSNDSKTMPPWVVEGMADYARYVFGINNVNANWTLTAFSNDQSYKNGYRITARFFVWLEKHKDAHLMKKLDEVLRHGAYNDNTWVKLTGESADQLWAEYAANPALDVEYDKMK